MFLSFSFSSYFLTDTIIITIYHDYYYSNKTETKLESFSHKTIPSRNVLLLLLVHALGRVARQACSPSVLSCWYFIRRDFRVERRGGFYKILWLLILINFDDYVKSSLNIKSKHFIILLYSFLHIIHAYHRS